MSEQRCTECWGETADLDLLQWQHVPVEGSWCAHSCHRIPVWCPIVVDGVVVTHPPEHSAP